LLLQVGDGSLGETSRTDAKSGERENGREQQCDPRKLARAVVHVFHLSSGKASIAGLFE
jgi:hypothetical protein